MENVVRMGIRKIGKGPVGTKVVGKSTVQRV